VPAEHDKRYGKLSIDENIRFLQFIEQKLNSNPELLEGKFKLTAVANFRVPLKYGSLLERVRKKLKKHKVSFSVIYRMLFDEFLKETTNA